MTRPAKARRKFPAIPPLREKNPAVQKIIEILEIGLGDRGNELDQFVTRRDVQEGYRVQGTRIIRTGGGGGIPPTSVGPLSNLVVMGAFRFINLAWEGINQDDYSYTEIWRSADDNLGNAVLVGTTRASVYGDPVGSGETWYYWVRAISTSGAPGPYNDTNGTMGQSALDPDYIIEQLAGQISESELANELLTPIQAIPGIQTTVGEHSAAISILEQGVDDNYAAIQLKASTSVVDDLEQDIQNISAQFTLKLDVNGYVSGIGLMNDGETSEFIVASDAVYFVDPAQSITEFDPDTNYSSMEALRDTQFIFGYAEVEGQKRFAINIPAYIPEAYITDLMVQNLSADKIFAASGTIADAIIGNGQITNAMITNVIRSNNYSAGAAGWLINKSGNANFYNIRARGHIEADSGYIAGSLQIGGTSRDLAEVVQLAENAGDTSIFQNWIRPGTTLINGNRIYTGDAYVDTLQIKGQAVTVPAQFSGSGFGGGSGWGTAIASMTYNHGANTSIPVAVISTVTGYAYSSDAGGTARRSWRYRVVANGSVIMTSPWYINDHVLLEEHAGGTIVTLMQNFPTGNRSVYIQVETNQSAFNNFVARAVLIGAKR